VGENQLKRFGRDFEASLVARLIQEGATIILDKGASEDEMEAADALIADVTSVKGGGGRTQVVEIDEPGNAIATTSAQTTPDILVWNGRIGMLAALIGECDLYIGYDSAGGHIAAALGIPCIGVFAGFGSRRFVDRWRPNGKAQSWLVAVDTLSGGREMKEVLADVLRHASMILKNRSSAKNKETG
jgi:ADP-heptose:LPS heptosyltransferase